MTTKKVDLVIYEKGERKVIGGAVVDLENSERQYLDLTGVVTDPKYKLLFNDHSRYSLNVEAFCEERTV